MYSSDDNADSIRRRRRLCDCRTRLAITRTAPSSNGHEIIIICPLFKRDTSYKRKKDLFVLEKVEKEENND